MKTKLQIEAEIARLDALYGEFDDIRSFEIKAMIESLRWVLKSNQEAT